MPMHEYLGIGQRRHLLSQHRGSGRPVLSRIRREHRVPLRSNPQPSRRRPRSKFNPVGFCAISRQVLCDDWHADWKCSRDIDPAGVAPLVRICWVGANPSAVVCPIIKDRKYIILPSIPILTPIRHQWLPGIRPLQSAIRLVDDRQSQIESMRTSKSQLSIHISVSDGRTLIRAGSHPMR